MGKMKKYTFPPGAIYALGKKKEHVSVAANSLLKVCSDLEGNSKQEKLLRICQLAESALRAYRITLDKV